MGLVIYLAFEYKSSFKERKGLRKNKLVSNEEDICSPRFKAEERHVHIWDIKEKKEVILFSKSKNRRNYTG